MKKLKILFLSLTTSFLAVSCSTNAADDSGSGEAPSSSETPSSSEPSPEPEPYRPDKNVHFTHYQASEPTCTRFGNKECWIKDNGSVFLESEKPDSDNIDEGNPNNLEDNSFKEYYISPLGHILEFESYKWASNHKSAQAYCVCTREGCDHEGYHPAKVTEHILTPATCLVPGSVEYIATFNDEHPETSNPVEIPPKKHSFAFDSFVWDTDPHHANAKYVCEYECGTADEHEAEVTSSITQTRTCTDSEETTYHAVYGTHHDDKVITTADPLGHDWSTTVTYKASIDKTSMTATRVCTRDGEHKDVETATLDNGKVTIVSDTEQYTEYAYSFINPAFSYTEHLRHYKTECNPHHLEPVAEVPSTCTEYGTLAHYICTNTNCGRLFWDAEAEHEILDDDDLVIKEYADHTASTPVNENTIDPTCTEPGNHDEVVYCSVCNHEMSREKVIDNPHGHKDPLHHHEEEPSTCTVAGYKEYYWCDTCGMLFKDAEGAKPTTLKEMTLRLADHDYECYPDHDYHWYECRVCHTTTDPVAHTGGNPVTENAVSATCTTDGSHDVVVYCYECGEELSRQEFVDHTPGHDYQFIEFEWDGYTSAKAVYRCTVCEDEVKYDALVTDEVISEPTCSSEGLIKYTATYNDHSEVKNVDTPINPDAHKWIATTYEWNAAQTEVTQNFECEYNHEHTKEEHPYTKASSDLYNFATAVNANKRSELASNYAAGYQDDKVYGDFNIFFKYKNDVTEKEKAFNVDVVMRTDGKNVLSSMDELFILRVDNSFKYGSVVGSGSGKSYGLYTSDLSASENKYTAVAFDNRSSFGTDYIGNSFEEDFCNFAKKSVILLNAHLDMDMDTYKVIVTVTYFTQEENYSKYLGYTQTFTTTIDEEDRSWNTINSIKFARQRQSSDTIATNLIIEEINVNNGVLDHNVESSYYSGKDWVLQDKFETPVIMYAPQ